MPASADPTRVAKAFGRRDGVVLPGSSALDRTSSRPSPSASGPVYSVVADSLASSKEAFKEAITRLDDALKVLLPKEEPIFKGQTRLGENAPPIAVKLALRELHSAQEQFENEDSESALHAAATLRDRADAEAASARHNADRATDAAAERARAKDFEERLRLADQSVDLLRNAIARRDNLLAEQRAAYYRDLLQYKGDNQAAPAPTYEKALEGVPVAERPGFFDACVFEALHLACDTPLADKAKLALEQASATQMAAQGKAANEVGKVKVELEQERKKRKEMQAKYESTQWRPAPAPAPDSHNLPRRHSCLHSHLHPPHRGACVHACVCVCGVCR